MTGNGFRQATCFPYHPSSNGLAERAVQTFKEALKKTSGDLETQLARFLFQYRNTSTGHSPAELLLGRKPRTHLDLLHMVHATLEPNNSEEVRTNVARNQ